MTDDVIFNKGASIERCLRRIEEEYAGAEQNLIENQTKQDAIVLNLQRVVNGYRFGHVCGESSEAWRASGQSGCILTAANHWHSSS